MKPVDELTFEEAFAELEQTVAQLESGDLTLEASLTLFERGQALAARCGTQLDTAELKVQQLLPDEAGELRPTPFDPEEAGR